jgi:hypothetical protein
MHKLYNELSIICIYFINFIITLVGLFLPQTQYGQKCSIDLERIAISERYKLINVVHTSGGEKSHKRYNTVFYEIL